VPIISLEGLHQLHIFIFVMTVVHVVYCCATVFLGFYKVWGLSTQSICVLYCTDTRQTELQLSDSLMRMVAILSQMHGWKKWEEETRAVGYDHTSGKYGFV
jgi:hypothetical protein